MGKFYRTYRPYLILLFLASLAYAGNISDPLVIRDGDFKMLNQELKKVYDNFNNLAVASTIPNGSRIGTYGDMILLKSAETYYLEFCITASGGSSWLGIPLTAIP